MPYPPGWERLSDAATNVMTRAGVSKDEAQTDICQAIADGADISMPTEETQNQTDDVKNGT